ncbi:MAG: hypothetical protein SVR94_17030 [Pseudomonadota bacterium]|nr:hypothetical protein [Pseudomonadota bacterium]
MHIKLDLAVLSAYGWQDVALDHGFHKTDLGIRFTISEKTRREVLIRLLKLNHQRYEEEVLAGLHGEKDRKKWIKEHGETGEGPKEGDQLALVDAGTKEKTTKENKEKVIETAQPEFFRCQDCGKLLRAGERDVHTKDVHMGENLGYESVGREV